MAQLGCLPRRVLDSSDDLSGSVFRLWSWLLAWLFLFAVLMSAALLFTMVFFVRVLHAMRVTTCSQPPSQIIMFSDLECDYINPIDLCNKLNQVRTISSVSYLSLLKADVYYI